MQCNEASGRLEGLLRAWVKSEPGKKIGETEDPYRMKVIRSMPMYDVRLKVDLMSAAIAVSGVALSPSVDPHSAQFHPSALSSAARSGTSCRPHRVQQQQQQGWTGACQ